MTSNGVWLSLVERLVRDQEVASSNLVTPTDCNFKPNQDLDFLPVFGSEAFSRGAKRYIPLCSLNKGEASQCRVLPARFSRIVSIAPAVQAVATQHSFT